jgi:hypothetical protein
MRSVTPNRYLALAKPGRLGVTQLGVSKRLGGIAGGIHETAERNRVNIEEKL